MRTEVVDRQALVWSKNTGYLVVPSQEDAMGTLPRHTPLMAFLVPGRVEANLFEGRSLVFEVNDDFMTIDKGRAYVVVEHSDTGHTEQPGVGRPGTLRPGTRSKGTKGGDMRTFDVILAVIFAGALASLTFLSVYFVRLRGLLHKHSTFQCVLRRKGDHWVPRITTL